jgi:hypothetical protein
VQAIPLNVELKRNRRELKRRTDPFRGVRIVGDPETEKSNQRGANLNELRR